MAVGAGIHLQNFGRHTDALHFPFFYSLAHRTNSPSIRWLSQDPDTEIGMRELEETLRPIQSLVVVCNWAPPALPRRAPSAPVETPSRLHRTGHGFPRFLTQSSLEYAVNTLSNLGIRAPSLNVSSLSCGMPLPCQSHNGRLRQSTALHRS